MKIIHYAARGNTRVGSLVRSSENYTYAAEQHVKIHVLAPWWEATKIIHMQQSSTWKCTCWLPGERQRKLYICSTWKYTCWLPGERQRKDQNLSNI